MSDFSITHSECNIQMGVHPVEQKKDFSFFFNSLVKNPDSFHWSDSKFLEEAKKATYLPQIEVSPGEFSETFPFEINIPELLSKCENLKVDVYIDSEKFEIPAPKLTWALYVHNDHLKNEKNEENTEPKLSLRIPPNGSKELDLLYFSLLSGKKDPKECTLEESKNFIKAYLKNSPFLDRHSKKELLLSLPKEHVEALDYLEDNSIIEQNLPDFVQHFGPILLTYKNIKISDTYKDSECFVNNKIDHTILGHIGQKTRSNPRFIEKCVQTWGVKKTAPYIVSNLLNRIKKSGKELQSTKIVQSVVQFFDKLDAKIAFQKPSDQKAENAKEVNQKQEDANIAKEISVDQDVSKKNEEELAQYNIDRGEIVKEPHLAQEKPLEQSNIVKETSIDEHDDPFFSEYAFDLSKNNEEEEGLAQYSIDVGKILREPQLPLEKAVKKNNIVNIVKNFFKRTQ